MSRRPISHPIEHSRIEAPVAVKFLLTRVMREINAGGAITHVKGLTLYQVDYEKLRIVIGKGMAIAHRIGHGAGEHEAHQKLRQSALDYAATNPRRKK